MASSGFIDIHSHILPVMDHGSKSLDESVAMLTIAVSEGISTLYATPHYLPGISEPSQTDIIQYVHKLEKIARKEGINIEIKKGAEYFFKEEMMDLFDYGEIITLGDSNCVLIEFDPMNEGLFIRKALKNILCLGYRPILAHVERYPYLMKDGFALLKEFRSFGVLTQVNCDSICGVRGRKVKEQVLELLKYHVVDFVSTNAHSTKERGPYIKKCASILQSRVEKDYADALLYGNAKKYLGT